MTGSRRRALQLRARCVALGGEPLGELARLLVAAAADPAERARDDPEDERGDDPAVAVAVADASCTSQSPKTSVSEHADPNATTATRVSPSSSAISLGRSRRSAATLRTAATAAPPRSRNAPITWRKRSQSYVLTARELHSARWTRRERHLQLLTETIAAVNSTLDLEEVLALVARKVADALDADACFVYLYDERADELVLRATHGTRVEEMTRRPRMRLGEGITGAAAAERAPVMLPAQAHLDPRFKSFPNLPEDQFESILAVPILARDDSSRARSTCARVEPREFTHGGDRPAPRDRGAGRAVDPARAALRGGAAAGRRARGARADLRGRVRLALPRGVARGDRADDDGRARRDGRGARARGRQDRLARGAPRAHAERLPLRWRGRQIGELVCDRDTPFSDDERRCSRRSRTMRRSRSSTGAR